MGDAVNHGRAHEATAIQEFSKVFKKKVEPCGLFIDHERNFLAATPDGMIPAEDAILEVKCPYTGRKSKIHKD